MEFVVRLVAMANWSVFERRRRSPTALLALVGLAILASLFVAHPAAAHTEALDQVETAADAGGPFGHVSAFLADFQRRANAQISFHMNAMEGSDDLVALLLALAVAFAYGAVHALGPGHGKFVIVSYFLGREARVMRGVVMAVQISIVHVIAAVSIVWLADIVLRGGFGIGLSDVPEVRAASFLIIVGIGLYMLYRAVHLSMSVRAEGMHGHAHHCGPGHHHGHGHGHGHTHGRGSRAEGGLLALAAGMVPCPGAVLIMLYAVANDLIVPGSLLVGAMSLGIGSTICVLGVGAILARQAAMRMMERSGHGSGVAVLRHGMNYGGAALVTVIGLLSFVAYLHAPLG